MAGGAPHRRVRRPPRQGRSGPRARGLRRAVAWDRHLAEARLDLHRLARGARRPRAAAVPAGDLPRGVRPRRRPGPRQPPRRGAARPDPDRLRHRGAAGSASCRRSWPSRSCGARATPSPAPAPTWPTSPPGPAWSTGDRLASSTARRCGPRWPTRPTGASWSPAPSPGSKRHHGLSYLLVPMDQEGVEVRPIIQLTGTSEFNEVFFTGARTDADQRRRSARATAGRSRWARSASSAASPRSASRSASSASSTRCSSWPAPTAPYDDPVIRDRLARAQVELEVIRLNALRTLLGGPGAPAGQHLQAALGRLAPHPRRARDAGPRRRLARRPGPTTTSTSGSGCSCSPAPTPSTAAPTRSSATSSPSACSACPGSSDRGSR